MKFQDFLNEKLNVSDFIEAAKTGKQLSYTYNYKGIPVIELLYKNSDAQKQQTLQEAARELVLARVKNAKTADNAQYYYDPKEDWFYVILKVTTSDGDISFAATRGQLNSLKKWSTVFIKNYEVDTNNKAYNELTKTNGKPIAITR